MPASAASTVSVSGRPTVSRSWILPRCSRRRRPSARKKKSSLPRSAVWARWTNDSNSIWLFDSGSLHTVVLFTPGEVGGEDDLLRAPSFGLLPSRRSGCPGGRRPSRARSVRPSS